MRFKIFSVEISISYSIICFAAICIITGIFEGFLYCISAVIFHESGHIAAMCFYGFPPEKIKVSLFEISITDRKRQDRSFKQNFIIIFFGPLANLICFILFYLVYLFGNNFLFPLAAANLSVGIFNLLPVLSLDGGQLLYAALCRFFSDMLSERIVNTATFIMIFPLAFLGFLLLFNSKYNFSLLAVCVYLVISLISRNNRFY